MRRTRPAPPVARIEPALRERTPAVKSSLEYALLGLVSEVPGVTGYDIAKIFNRSMRHFWHAYQGQIYPTLERMQAAGWIKSRTVIQSGRPNKHRLSITAAGERALERWLTSPFEKIKLKYAPLLRTRFIGHLGADRAIAEIREHRRQSATYLDELRAIERGFFARFDRFSDQHLLFSFFTLKYGIGWMEHDLRWCDWVIGEIERHRGLLQPSSRKRKAAIRQAPAEVCDQSETELRDRTVSHP